MTPPRYKTIEDAVGGTPLVRLQRIGAQENAARGNVLLAKLEAGSLAQLIRRYGDLVEPGGTPAP